MAYTTTWDAANEASPANTDVVSSGDDKIRELKVSIRERIAKDHYMDIAGTDADHGEHQKITFQSQIAKPTNVANKGFLYIKDVAAKAELHWEDEDGNELALTSAGTIPALAILAKVYPIGCIYTTIIATNPATVFGFGTWTAFGAGKVLVGLNSADTDFDLAEEIGGAKTVAGDPHTHSVVVPATGWTSTYVGAHTDGRWASYPSGSETYAAGQTLTSASTTPDATSVVQPYIVVYFWKRTA